MEKSTTDAYSNSANGAIQLLKWVADMCSDRDLILAATCSNRSKAAFDTWVHNTDRKL
jgi:hypothetical protein